MCTKKTHAKPAGTERAVMWVLTNQHVCWGRPPRWNAGCGLAPVEPDSEGPETGVYLGRSSRVTEDKVFLEK